MAGVRTIDPVPGRLLWAKVGDWPWWPACVVQLNEVPAKVRGMLGDRENGVIVRFFEEPPKYQRLSEKQLRPWQAHFARFSMGSGAHKKQFKRSLADAVVYHGTLSDELKTDGNILLPDPAAPKPAKRRKQGGGGGSGAAASAPEPPIEDDKSLAVARRAVGEALLTGEADRIVGATQALARFRVTERVVRALELGKIATLLSRHENAAVAKAGAEYARALSTQLVVERAAAAAVARAQQQQQQQQQNN